MSRYLLYTIFLLFLNACHLEGYEEKVFFDDKWEVREGTTPSGDVIYTLRKKSDGKWDVREGTTPSGDVIYTLRKKSDGKWEVREGTSPSGDVVCTLRKEK